MQAKRGKDVSAEPDTTRAINATHTFTSRRTILVVTRCPLGVGAPLIEIEFILLMFGISAIIRHKNGRHFLCRQTLVVIQLRRAKSTRKRQPPICSSMGIKKAQLNK